MKTQTKEDLLSLLRRPAHTILLASCSNCWQKMASKSAMLANLRCRTTCGPKIFKLLQVADCTAGLLRKAHAIQQENGVCRINLQAEQTGFYTRLELLQARPCSQNETHRIAKGNPPGWGAAPLRPEALSTVRRQEPKQIKTRRELRSRPCRPEYSSEEPRSS